MNVAREYMGPPELDVPERWRDPAAVVSGPVAPDATALFEFRKGHWHVEGKRLDEMRPDEAVGRDQRYEAVAVSSPHPRRVG